MQPSKTRLTFSKCHPRCQPDYSILDGKCLPSSDATFYVTVFLTTIIFSRVVHNNNYIHVNFNKVCKNQCIQICFIDQTTVLYTGNCAQLLLKVFPLLKRQLTDIIIIILKIPIIVPSLYLHL